MILITGAGGKTGRAVLRQLVARQQPVRALVHRQAQVPPMHKLGAHSVAVGDMRSPEVLSAAMKGIRAVYHICPNVHPAEVAIGKRVLTAAKTAGVTYFVFHSVMHPQTRAMPHHWRKLQVEEMLLTAGLPFTILQPAAYMQNLLAQWEQIETEGTLSVPYGANTQLGMVDLEDVAEVAARVLTESGHEGAMYQLCGAERLTQTEVAEILGRVLGRAVRVREIPHAEWMAAARRRGLSRSAIQTLVKMFAYYHRHGFPGNARVLTCLLGRAPTSLAQFAERVLREL